MYYLRRRNSGVSPEIPADQMASNKSISIMEDQVEGAVKRDIDMSVEGKASAELNGNGGMAGCVFATDEIINDARHQPTDQGDV